MYPVGVLFGRTSYCLLGALPDRCRQTAERNCYQRLLLGISLVQKVVPAAWLAAVTALCWMLLKGLGMLRRHVEELISVVPTLEDVEENDVSRTVEYRANRRPGWNCHATGKRPSWSWRWFLIWKKAEQLGTSHDNVEDLYKYSKQKTRRPSRWSWRYNKVIGISVPRGVQSRPQCSEVHCSPVSAASFFCKTHHALPR